MIDVVTFIQTVGTSGFAFAGLRTVEYHGPTSRLGTFREGVHPRTDPLSGYLEYGGTQDKVCWCRTKENWKEPCEHRNEEAKGIRDVPPYPHELGFAEPWHPQSCWRHGRRKIRINKAYGADYYCPICEVEREIQEREE